jgi:PAS domain S-box-containing protein
MEAMSTVDAPEVVRLSHACPWLSEFIAAVENFPIGVSITTKSGKPGFSATECFDDHYKYIYVNKHFAGMTGYGSAEIIGCSPQFLYCHKTDMYKVENLREAMKSRRRARVTLINERRDGSSFENHMSLKLVRDDFGAVCYVIGLHLNVNDFQGSDATNFEKKKEENDAILKLLPNFVAFDDELYRYTGAASGRMTS